MLVLFISLFVLALGCTYLHCTALCYVSEFKLKLKKTLAMTLPWWQHHKHSRAYYYYYYYGILQVPLRHSTSIFTSTSSIRRTESPALRYTTLTSIGIWPSVSGTIQKYAELAFLLVTCKCRRPVKNRRSSKGNNNIKKCYETPEYSDLLLLKSFSNYDYQIRSNGH